MENNKFEGKKENIESPINFENLSEEEINELKDSNPDEYYEIINKMAKKEEDEYEEKLKNVPNGAIYNEKPDDDKEDPGWEYYRRFNKK